MKWPVQSLKHEKEKSFERRRSIVKQVSPHKATSLSVIGSERPTSNLKSSTEMSGFMDITDQRDSNKNIASRNDIQIVFESGKTPKKKKYVTGEKDSSIHAEYTDQATLESPDKDGTRIVSINRNSETKAINTTQQRK